MARAKAMGVMGLPEEVEDNLLLGRQGAIEGLGVLGFLGHVFRPFLHTGGGLIHPFRGGQLGRLFGLIPQGLEPFFHLLYPAQLGLAVGLPGTLLTGAQGQLALQVLEGPLQMLFRVKVHVVAHGAHGRGGGLFGGQAQAGGAGENTGGQGRHQGFAVHGQLLLDDLSGDRVIRKARRPIHGPNFRPPFGKFGL